MIRPALKGRIFSKTLTLAAVFVATSGIFFLPEAEANDVTSATMTSADIGTSYNLDFSYSIPEGTLSAMGTFTLENLTASSATLDWTLADTASTTLGTNPGLQVLGMDASSATGASLSMPGAEFTFAGSGNVPGFNNENVCVSTGNNCSGGAYHKDLLPGHSDAFVLALSGDFGSSPSLTLSDFAVKFQTSDISYEFGAGSGGLSETPEPESLVLFASALLLGLFGRIRRRFPARPAGSTSRG